MGAAKPVVVKVMVVSMVAVGGTTQGRREAVLEVGSAAEAMVVARVVAASVGGASVVEVRMVGAKVEEACAGGTGEEEERAWSSVEATEMKVEPRARGRAPR